MSILNEPNINPPTLAETTAYNIKNQALTIYKEMVNAFNSGSKYFWQNPNGLSPSEISQALGTEAREIFELHYALGQLINNIKPEAIVEGWSVIGQFTMNEDGTVTIIEPTTTESPTEPTTTEPPIVE